MIVLNKKILGLTIFASIFLTNTNAYSQDFELKPGDLLFQQSDCGPFCDAINKVTQGVNGIDFSHVGILIKNSENNLIVLEAVTAGVKETPLEDFLKRSVDSLGLPKVAVGRLKKSSQINLKNIELLKKNYVGKKYDDIFDINNDSYYCSELVYFLFQDKKGNPIFTLEPMTFKDPDTGKTFPVWEDYYKKLNIDIPEGQPGLNPGSISRSSRLVVYFPYSNFK